MVLKKLFKEINLISDTALLVYLSLLKFAVHLLTASNYGFFRDELYTIAASKHLDFGYVDLPPLVPFLAAVSRTVFGESMFSYRIFPAAAGALTVLVTGSITREIGGKRFAQVISAIAVMASPGILGTNSILTYDSFDLLLSSLFFYGIIRILKEEKLKNWIIFGAVAGIGLMVKLSMLFFGFTFVAGLLFTPARREFGKKNIWIGGMIVLAVCSPYIIWQVTHGIPILEYWTNYAENKTYHSTVLDFFVNQFIINNPVSFPLWICGLIYFLFSKQGKPYRVFGWMYVSLYAVFQLTHMKYYLISPLYIVLFAGGGTLIERMPDQKPVKWIKLINPAYLSALVISGILLSPFAIPVLEVKTLIKLESFVSDIIPSLGKTENVKTAELPPNFADRFGWENMTKTVAEVYYCLNDEERKDCFIFGVNYGEAGAIDYFGKAYNLPKAISGHLSYYFWGPGDYSGKTGIVIGVDRKTLEGIFGKVETGGIIRSQYAIPYENNLPVYICRNLKAPIKDIWKSCKTLN